MTTCKSCEYSQRQIEKLQREVESLNKELDYWKVRCQLSEKCLEESPCDPDVTTGQINTWVDYSKFRAENKIEHT